MKKAFNALLFKVGTMRRWPQEILDGLPEGWTGAKLRRAIIRKHPDLSKLVVSGVGYGLFHRESTIMCAVLMRCMAAGIVVLPVHDAVICPTSAILVVRSIMQEEAYRISGSHIPVTIKGEVLRGSP